jgi:hypothetical protein
VFSYDNATEPEPDMLSYDNTTEPELDVFSYNNTTELEPTMCLATTTLQNQNHDTSENPEWDCNGSTASTRQTGTT